MRGKRKRASVLETLQAPLKGAYSQEEKKRELRRHRAPLSGTDSHERETPSREQSIDQSRSASDSYDGIGCTKPVVSITYT